jgi:hypothetical protein
VKSNTYNHLSGSAEEGTIMARVATADTTSNNNGAPEMMPSHLVE